MDAALVIGGTGFVGRHTVAEFLDHGYTVTALSRGTVEAGVPEWDDAEHIVGDRTEDGVLADAARRVDPDVVVDCAAYYPTDVRRAIDVFADVDAYVYVSSGGVYAGHEIPKREDETPLHDCTPEQATDDTMATYGPRKAECDRPVDEALDTSVEVAMERTVAESVASGRDGSAFDPGREAERRLIESLTAE